MAHDADVWPRTSRFSSYLCIATKAGLQLCGHTAHGIHAKKEKKKCRGSA